MSRRSVRNSVVGWSRISGVHVVLAGVVGAVLASGCAAQESVFAPPDPDQIERAEVERLVRTLASDDMRGRRAFTDDALRAADFLAEEFAAAGLSPLEGSGGHLQRFAVRAISVSESSVTVNGKALAADRFVVRMGSPSLSWATGDVPVTVIAADDAEAQAKIFGALRGDSDMLLLVDGAHQGIVRRISGFLRRPTRTVGDKKGRDLVVAIVEADADATYAITGKAEVTTDDLANVVGMIPGRRANEFVLFSAHYDHIGIRPAVEGDSIANGANDDASGTAAVVALGKYFADRGTPERTLLFVAFTAEEGGGYGSQYFSSQLDPDQIIAMFNIEMIGKPAVSGPNTAWITGFERSSFGPLLQKAVEGTVFSFYPDPYPDQNLFYRSDNATLARLGVPAHSISTTPIDVDQDYHQVSDQIETLDLDHMTNAIRAIAMGAETMVTGEATPTRVDPSTVN
jgi:Peptidase family M28